MRRKLDDEASVEDTQELDVVTDQDTPEEVSAPVARTVRLRTRDASRRLHTEHGSVYPVPTEFDVATAEALQAAAKQCGVALVVEDA